MTQAAYNIAFYGKDGLLIYISVTDIYLSLIANNIDM